MFGLGEGATEGAGSVGGGVGAAACGAGVGVVSDGGGAGATASSAGAVGVAVPAMSAGMGAFFASAPTATRTDSCDDKARVPSGETIFSDSA